MQKKGKKKNASKSSTSSWLATKKKNAELERKNAELEAQLSALKTKMAAMYHGL